MAPQVLPFLVAQQKTEILREARDVSSHCSLQGFRFNFVQFRKMKIQHDLLIAHEEDSSVDNISRDYGFHGRPFFEIRVK